MSDIVKAAIIIAIAIITASCIESYTYTLSVERPEIEPPKKEAKGYYSGMSTSLMTHPIHNPHLSWPHTQQF